MSAALISHGYTSREAGFIHLAALLSGYFVRRQFNDYAETECGAIAQAFIDKGTKLGHLTGTKHLGGRAVYHFTSFSLYSALGDRNNRNRRLHQNETIRRRLMALDYCISNRQSGYVLTEKDKVEFFQDRGLSEADLPAEVFGGSARRYFVDRQPIGRDLHLAYVDEGLCSLSPWEVFLSKHRAIIQQLPQSVTVFASPDESRFVQAQRIFRQTVTGSDAAGTLDAGRLRSYFEARRLFDAREFSSFTQARLDQLREDRKVFTGEQIESLFLEWKRAGDQALLGLGGRQASLQMHVLKHRYDWLSPVRKEIRDAADSSAREKGQRGRHRQAGQADR